MDHVIAPCSGIEVARPQSTIVRERGRALIIDACRDRRDTPSAGMDCRLKDWKVLPEAIKAVTKKDETTDIKLQVKGAKGRSTEERRRETEDTTVAYTSSNSEYVKSLKPRPDKVLLARKFLRNARDGTVTLSEASQGNIGLLFTEIEFTEK